MTRASTFDQIRKLANEVLGDSAHAAGVLANHLNWCEECSAGTLCKWANELARAAGDPRASLPSALYASERAL